MPKEIMSAVGSEADSGGKVLAHDEPLASTLGVPRMTSQKIKSKPIPPTFSLIMHDVSSAALLPVDEVVGPSEHKTRDKADDCQADYAIEDTAKGHLCSRPDCGQIKAVHERIEEIDRR